MFSKDLTELKDKLESGETAIVNPPDSWVAALDKIFEAGWELNFDGGFGEYDILCNLAAADLLDIDRFEVDQWEFDFSEGPGPFAVTKK